MRITEEEKKEILSKYQDDTSDELLKHMKRVFPTYEVDLFNSDTPTIFITVDDKSYYVKGNKKFLVSKISNILEDEWFHLGTQKLRRTVKKFIDGISL